MAQEFHFGEFVLDQSSYRLQRGDRPVRLERLPMELLLLLVERHGELISREDIAERLWGKDVFLDVDHSINTAIRKVRSALRDDPEKPRYVQTVVGKGYRFAAPVVCTNGEITPVAPQTGQSEPALAVAATSARPMRAWAAVGTVVVLAVVASVLLLGRTRSAGPTAKPIRSVAVLPLANLSSDQAQDYFADGITEAIIGRLATIPDLRVISRTSAMQFKATKVAVPEIARALHVDAVVEGSVVREGNRVRVTVQLIRGATDEHMWAAEYDREFRSILALEDDVAGTIVSQIRMTVRPDRRSMAAATRPVDPEAYENYLKGRYYLNQRTEQGIHRSIDYFQQALTIDKNYALAYCGLADAYALLGFRGRVPSRDALAHAKAAALKAVELDETLADAHASLAFIAETHEWDWAAAEREYRRALELNPGDARTHHWYAGYLVYMGRFDEGIGEAKRARELDPLSLPINNALAGRLLVAGRVDEALAQVRETLDLDPHYAPAHQTLGWAYLNRGQRPQAIEEFQQAVQLSGVDDYEMTIDLGYAYAVSGRRDDAGKILAKMRELHQRNLVQSGAVGILYGALGEPDQAFAWLQKAYEEHDPELTYLKVPGRRFAPLRDDPRFHELVAKMGLPE